MSVEGLDASEELAVVADGDEHLKVRAHGCLENREGPRGELVLLKLSNLVLTAEINGQHAVLVSRGGGGESTYVSSLRGLFNSSL